MKLLRKRKNNKKLKRTNKKDNNSSGCYLLFIGTRQISTALFNIMWYNIIVRMVIFMNDYKLALLIIKNKARLDSLIKNDADYSKILKQSKKLDTLIMQKMINQIEPKKLTST